MGSPWQGRAVLWVPREAMTKCPPPTLASWVPCCVLRNCVLSPVPGLASRAQAVSGQGRSLDKEMLWDKDTCHLGEATTPRRPFSSPESQGKSEHSRAPHPHPAAPTSKHLFLWQHLTLSSPWRSTSVQRQSSSESGALWGLKDRVSTRRWSGFPGRRWLFMFRRLQLLMPTPANAS